MPGALTIFRGVLMPNETQMKCQFLLSHFVPLLFKGNDWQLIHILQLDVCLVAISFNPEFCGIQSSHWLVIGMDCNYPWTLSALEQFFTWHLKVFISYAPFYAIAFQMSVKYFRCGTNGARFGYWSINKRNCSALLSACKYLYSVWTLMHN